MKSRDPEEMRGGLEGPVFPIVTPFDNNNRLDIASVNQYVNFLLDCGAQTIMTTVGTSRFNLLSEDEIISLNSEVVKANRGHSKIIVSGPIIGDLQKNIEYAVNAQK